jgi:hypothetical protein
MRSTIGLRKANTSESVQAEKMNGPGLSALIIVVRGGLDGHSMYGAHTPT